MQALFEKEIHLNQKFELIMNHKLIITPHTKVSELLDAYPELEPILLELSPAFEKLKNPLLRKTIARFTTLKHAASIA